MFLCDLDVFESLCLYVLHCVNNDVFWTFKATYFQQYISGNKQKQIID